MEGVVSPLGIGEPLPSTSISGATVPVPWMAKLYGFSSLSSLAISIVAVRRPAASGSNSTMKVVYPSGSNGLPGWALTLKSAACVPEITT